MRQYRSRNRGGPQSCIRLSSHCNLTEMILNHSQKLCAWYKYGDFPFFPSFLAVVLEVFIGSDWCNYKEQQIQYGGMRKDTGEKQLQAIQPLRASPSTPTGHYRLWQGIPEPNLEPNGLLNTRTLLIQRGNEQKAPALHFSPAPFLLPWDCESGFFCITEGFLEALTEWKGLH